MTPRRMSILGVGLLGGSLGLACRRVFPECQIIGYGHRRESLERALGLGAIDVAFDNPADAVRDSDLVVRCTPVGRFSDLLREISGSLKPGALLTDVGSTKRQVVAVAESLLEAGVHFVGSHPMAGSEKRGVEHARADMFNRALCILTPTPQTDLNALEQVDQFWQRMGMRTCRLTPQDHDRLLAFVSHLPHVLAATAVTIQPPEALNLAGNGFLDATRIASGDGALWRDILLENADNLKISLAAVRQSLDEVEQMLDMPDGPQKLAQWLNSAADRRASMIHVRSQISP